MKRFLALALLSLVALTAGRAQDDPGGYVLDVQGVIGPATVDYVTRGLDRASEAGARLVILRMNTPGGLSDSMRAIIEAIIQSPTPVATYVAPSGSRATSAGTYIVYGSHIAAMAPGTTIGAATPVQMGGGMPGTDEPAPAEDGDDGDGTSGNGDNGAEDASDGGEEAPQPGSAMERKIINDAVSYIRSLAELRGRNADWGERAVRDAVSIVSSEALELNVIDLIARDVDELLERIHGREVEMRTGTVELDTQDLVLEYIEPDWRNELLAVLTNPNVAYVLMLIGIYGIIFELANPGAIVPGVLGSVSLLLALYAFQVLPINYAGLGLMLLGSAFMVAEAFLPSFGILGVGGIVAFILGSLLLLDTGVEAYELSLEVILGVSAVSFVVIFGIATMAVRSRQRRVASGAEQMEGAVTEAAVDFRDGRGKVRLMGELWNATLDGGGEARQGERMRVVAVEGLMVRVERSGPERSGDESS